MNRIHWVGRLALAMAISVVSACGDDTETADPAADLAKAEAAILKATDLPAGWNSRPHEPLPGEDQLERDIARCLGITPPAARGTAHVRSQDFTQGFATASATITFVKTEKEAKADAAAVTSNKFGECIKPGYADQVHHVAPEGNTVTKARVEPLTLPRFGDRSVAQRVITSIHIPEPNIDLDIHIDVVRFFKGRAEAELVVVAPGMPFPNDLVSGLAGKMVARL